MAVCIFVLRYCSYLLGIREVHWTWKQTIKGEGYMEMAGGVTGIHLPFVCAFATANLGGELTLVPWQLARTRDLHERHMSNVNRIKCRRGYMVWRLRVRRSRQSRRT